MSLKYAANLTFLWSELPYFDRFDAAAAAGFEAVEILFPYEVAVQETKAALQRNGLEMILLNAPPPNYTGGPRGFAAEPERVARFQRDMTRSFRYAQALGVSFVHVMSGMGAGEAAQQCFVENLRWAAEQAPKGLTLTIEPLNQVSMPGYFNCDYALAAEVLAAVDMPNVGLQYDSFHAQMIHGDALAVFEDYLPLIRHIQLGDSPGRGAPGTGDVDFVRLLPAIAGSGYDGWVSGEYEPGGATGKTLGWRELA